MRGLAPWARRRSHYEKKDKEEARRAAGKGGGVSERLVSEVPRRGESAESVRTDTHNPNRV